MAYSNLLSGQEEMVRYLEHNNDAADEGYVRHLMDIGGRVISKVVPGGVGLDYGSGPEPVMGQLLRERGFGCVCYDPFFSNDRTLLRNKYDYVVCCEVAEHFHEPFVDFLKIFNLLNDGGVFGMKTALWDPGSSFEDWYYPNDPTHVSFYTEQTLDWLTRRFGFSVEERDSGRIVWRKNPVKDPLQVVAAIIREKGMVFTAARKSGALKGRWEFPGGKVEEGESAEDALEREFREEFGMDVIPDAEIACIMVPEGRRWIELLFLSAAIDAEPLRLASHSEWKWVDAAAIKGLEMPVGDRVFAEVWL